MNHKPKGGDKFFEQLRVAGIADEAFERDIVTMFIEEGGESLQKLKTAFSANNFDKMGTYAHKLKSSFLMFDLLAEHELAVKIESKPLHDIDALNNTITLLSNKCETSFARLKREYNV